MQVIKKAVEFVNPGQISVILGDCPLYAQQEKFQWKYVDEGEESNMGCFMDFLHVEMASQECRGKLLAECGWDRVFHQAKIFTSGIAASLVGGKHV